jgi:putative tricarboxylic transport membrane protein
MKADEASGLFWLVIGGAAMYGAVRLGLGTSGEPGPGFLPFLAGLVVSLLSGVVMLQATLKKGRAGSSSVASLWKGVRLRKLFALGFLLLAYVLVLERLGFVLTSFIILFVIFRFIEGLSWAKTIVFTLVASVGTYALLDRLLNATLPQGFLGF